MNRIIALAATVVALGLVAAPTIAAAQSAPGQDLPDGTAMPLGEFQEGLHLREGLPLTSQLRGAIAADLLLRGTELLPIQLHGRARARR